MTIININNPNLNISLSIVNKTSPNNMKTNNLIISLTINSKMYANGQTDTQNVSVATSSSYQADGLTSLVAKVLVSGNSKATVNASEFLSAEIKDFGEILYKGYPQVNQSTILGKISKIT
ncbi:MAG: GIN domain-containing protein [Methanobacterium formicicum]